MLFDDHQGRPPGDGPAGEGDDPSLLDGALGDSQAGSRRREQFGRHESSVALRIAIDGVFLRAWQQAVSQEVILKLGETNALDLQRDPSETGHRLLCLSGERCWPDASTLSLGTQELPASSASPPAGPAVAHLPQNRVQPALSLQLALSKEESGATLVGALAVGQSRVTMFQPTILKIIALVESFSVGPPQQQEQFGTPARSFQRGMEGSRLSHDQSLHFESPAGSLSPLFSSPASATPPPSLTSISRSRRAFGVLPRPTARSLAGQLSASAGDLETSGTEEARPKGFSAEPRLALRLRGSLERLALVLADGKSTVCQADGTQLSVSLVTSDSATLGAASGEWGVGVRVTQLSVLGRGNPQLADGDILEVVKRATTRVHGLPGAVSCQGSPEAESPMITVKLACGISDALLDEAMLGNSRQEVMTSGSDASMADRWSTSAGSAEEQLSDQAAEQARPGSAGSTPSPGVLSVLTVVKSTRVFLVDSFVTRLVNHVATYNPDQPSATALDQLSLGCNEPPDASMNSIAAKEERGFSYSGTDHGGPLGMSDSWKTAQFFSPMSEAPISSQRHSSMEASSKSPTANIHSSSPGLKVVTRVILQNCEAAVPAGTQVVGNHGDTSSVGGRSPIKLVMVAIVPSLSVSLPSPFQPLAELCLGESQIGLEHLEFVGVEGQNVVLQLQGSASSELSRSVAESEDPDDSRPRRLSPSGAALDVPLEIASGINVHVQVSLAPPQGQVHGEADGQITRVFVLVRAVDAHLAGAGPVRELEAFLAGIEHITSLHFEPTQESSGEDPPASTAVQCVVTSATVHLGSLHGFPGEDTPETAQQQDAPLACLTLDDFCLDDTISASHRNLCLSWGKLELCYFDLVPMRGQQRASHPGQMIVPGSDRGEDHPLIPGSSSRSKVPICRFGEAESALDVSHGAASRPSVSVVFQGFPWRHILVAGSFGSPAFISSACDWQAMVTLLQRLAPSNPGQSAPVHVREEPSSRKAAGHEVAESAVFSAMVLVEAAQSRGETTTSISPADPANPGSPLDHQQPLTVEVALPKLQVRVASRISEVQEFQAVAASRSSDYGPSCTAVGLGLLAEEAALMGPGAWQLGPSVSSEILLMLDSDPGLLNVEVSEVKGTVVVGHTEELSVEASVGVELSYFCQNKGAWEPCVEPWALQLRCAIQPRAGGGRVDSAVVAQEIVLFSPLPLELNITPSFMEVLGRLQHDLEAAARLSSSSMSSPLPSSLDIAGGVEAERQRLLSMLQPDELPRSVLVNQLPGTVCLRAQGSRVCSRCPAGSYTALDGTASSTDKRGASLVSIRLDLHGWDWSGSFSPDEVGDTQLKIRNHSTGETAVLQVDVAPVLVDPELLAAEFAFLDLEGEILSRSGTSSPRVGAAPVNGVLGRAGAAGAGAGAAAGAGAGPSFGRTAGGEERGPAAPATVYFVTISKDTSGFMPFRIDNLTKEILRFYQDGCEGLGMEDTLRPYNSCPYAWDEPCKPKRLVVEALGIPGIIGTFRLSSLGVLANPTLPATQQRAEAHLKVSLEADGPVRVLVFEDISTHFHQEKGQLLLRPALNPALLAPPKCAPLTPVVSLKLNVQLQALGVSLMSDTEELLYLSATNLRVSMVQDNLRHSVQARLGTLQVDNQLPGAIYPVLLACHALPAQTTTSASTVRRLHLPLVEAGSPSSQLAQDSRMSPLPPSPEYPAPCSAGEPSPGVTRNLDSGTPAHEAKQAAATGSQASMGGARSSAAGASPSSGNDTVGVGATTQRGLPEPFLELSVTKWAHSVGNVECLENVFLRILPFTCSVEEQLLLQVFEVAKQLGALLAPGSGGPVTSASSLSLGDDVPLQSDDLVKVLLSLKSQKETQREAPKRRGLACILDDRGGAETQGAAPLSLAPLRKTSSVSAPQPQPAPCDMLYIERLLVKPIAFSISFASSHFFPRAASKKGMLAFLGGVLQRRVLALADVEDAPVYLGAVSITNFRGRLPVLQRRLSQHYARHTLQELYKVVGSADVLGNPVGLVANIWQGISDFVTKPVLAAVKDPKLLPVGLRQGSASFLRSTVFALSDSIARIAHINARAVASLTLDHKQLEEMQHRRLEDPDEINVLGAIFEGLTGLLEEPVKGLQTGGILGLAGGAVKGSIRAVTKPLASALEFTALTAESIRNSARLPSLVGARRRSRLPRAIDFTKPLTSYSEEEAVTREVLAIYINTPSNLQWHSEVLLYSAPLSGGFDFAIITSRRLLCVRNLLSIDPDAISTSPILRPSATIEVALLRQHDLLDVLDVFRSNKVITGLVLNKDLGMRDQEHRHALQPVCSPFFSFCLEFITANQAADFESQLVKAVATRNRDGDRQQRARRIAFF